MSLKLGFLLGHPLLSKVHSFIFTMAAPRHAITTSGKGFQRGKNQHKSFDEMKRKIIQALVLALPSLHNPFLVEIDSSGYAMGAILM
jgi:hypothetical protein